MSFLSRKILMGSGVDTGPTADYNKVSALYHFNGTNGLSNAGFAKDGGTYSGSFSTANGPYQSEANPFSRPDGYWSVLFDGSDDYISISNETGLTPGTSDFTIECWVYFSSTTTNQGIFQLDTSPLSGTTYIAPVLFTGGGPYAGRWGTMKKYGGDQSLYADSSHNPVVGVWYHTAVVRTSNTVKVFVDGVQVINDFTDASDFTDRDSLVIGSMFSSSYQFTGYISNFRYVKGTALYTSAFTPPTTPLTNITNTQVLACQSHNFKENSSNSYTLTKTSVPKIETNAPFNSTTVYDPATHGGSVDFVASSADLVYGSAAQSVGSDWTIDFWFYPRAAGSYSGIIGTSHSSYYATQAQYTIHMNNGNLSLFRGNGSGYYDVTIGTPDLYAWHHVAISRSASATQAWLDGTRTLNSSTVTQPSSAGYLVLGRFYGDFVSYYYDGKLANFRIVDNSSIYSGATITVPTAPTTAVTDTLLLMNFNDLGLVDSLARKDSETLGNTQLSTAQKKFGTASALFDGSGDYILLRDNAAPRGYASWTIECWIYIDVHKNYNFIYAAGSSIQLGVGSDGRLGAWVADASGFIVNNLASTGDALSTTTWYHVALVRDYSASTVTWFINGTASGQATSVTGNVAFTTSPAHCLGAYGDGTLPFDGYIDEFRITNGQAVYTEDFTAPTEAFPNS